MTNVIS